MESKDAPSQTIRIDDSQPPARFLSPRTVALYGILIALTATITYTSAAPFSPTRGFFNLGESMVFFSALTFGWRAGCVCGGIGSATADILLGFTPYAPITLVAKGTEGFVAGVIGKLNGGRIWAMTLGVVAGGACMITIYFLGEFLILNTGFGPALAEVPVNMAQAILGGTIGCMLSLGIKRGYPSLAKG
jgi:uncharacterized membrane protein